MSKNFLCGMIFLLLVGMFVGGCGSDDVSTVRDGTMNMAPDVPIGKAFDQFFDKGSWKSFTSTENKRIVEFNGENKIFDETVNTKIQFKLKDDDTFSLEYFGVDGESLPNESAVLLLGTILDSYKSK